MLNTLCSQASRWRNNLHARGNVDHRFDADAAGPRGGGRGGSRWPASGDFGASNSFEPIRGGRLSDREIQQIVYGRWGQEPGEDVIVCRRSETQVEVHCHGGVSAVRRIIDDLTAAGATEQDWSAWISHHESTPIQAAARQALANATTLRAAAILLDQYHGAWKQRSIRSLNCSIDRIPILRRQRPISNCSLERRWDCT